MAVVSDGGTIELYVNRQLIARVSDGTYSHGRVGVVAEEDINPTEVAFSSAKVWQL
jgi:hypothetical protein